MAQPDPFDPTHALDGWRVPAPPALDFALNLESLRLTESAVHCAVDTRRLAPRGEQAAFDSTHALDSWRAPSPAPLDLELKSVLRAAGTRPDDAKKAWVKARGFEMLDVEDIEVSERPPPQAHAEAPRVEALPDGMPSPPLPAAEVGLPDAQALQTDDIDAPEEAALPLPIAEANVLDFRAEPPPAEPDLKRVIEEVRMSNGAPLPLGGEVPVLDVRLASPAAESDPQQVINGIKLPKVAPPVALAMPVLDLPAVTPRSARDPRLLARWQPLAWTALARRVRGATTEVLQMPQGPLVQSHSPQWLCALWRPQSVDAPLLGRWPEFAGLVGAETVFGALHQLLTHLPPRAQIWAAELEADWALVAELVLHQDTGLAPGHAQALRLLIESERSASLMHLSERYAAKGRVVRRRA